MDVEAFYFYIQFIREEVEEWCIYNGLPFLTIYHCNLLFHVIIILFCSFNNTLFIFYDASSYC